LIKKIPLFTKVVLKNQHYH